MRINIISDLNSETFSISLKVSEQNNETIYKVTFDDKRMQEKFGTFEIVKGRDFWKLPSRNDTDLISISSKIIYQIMELENSQEN